MDSPDGRTASGIGRSWPPGLLIQVVVGIVLSILLALVIALAGEAMTTAPVPDVRPIVLPAMDGEEDRPADVDYRHPLVRCTVFDSHTHCIQEAS